MAKGLGAIMSELAMMEKASTLENLKAPACPLCGEPMEDDGAGWFCYSGPDGKCPRMRALEDAMYQYASDEYIRDGMDIDPFQGQTFAAIVEPGPRPRLLARFGSVRGGGGGTNLRIWTWGDDTRDEDVPALIQEYGWTWMEWVPDELKAEV